MSYKLINYCEIDNFASQSYSRIHNVSEDLNLGDITLVDTSKIEDFDLLVGGSPCFVSGTPVFTKEGFKNIEDIKVGDEVLTHKNRFMPVDRIGHNLNKDIYELKAMGSLPILATPNHPFWVSTRKKTSKTINNKREYFWKFSEPYKKRLDELVPGKDFLCSPILQIEENPYNLDTETCWILGRYVADGCYSECKTKKGYIDKKYVITIGKNKIEDVDHILSKYCNSTQITSSKCKNYRISDKKIQQYIDLFDLGTNSITKNVANEILLLPHKLLKAFLDGYFSGDGCYIKKYNVYQATTISYNLAMTLQLAIQKVYKIGCRLYYDKRPATCVIEGRTVNQHSTYMIRFTKEVTKQKQYYVLNDMILYPIKSIEDKHYQDIVYNLEVRDDHTYNVQANICSNCQDFSSSGKKAGAVWTCKDCGYEYNPLTAHFKTRNQCPHCNSQNLERTRSSLIVEYLRILRDKMPKFAIYENVKNLIGKEFKPTFDLFVKELEEYGYNVYYQVLNAKYYGVPQNRERIILVAIRKDIDNGKFKYPEPFDSGIRLKDVLATRIEDKFYISKDKTEKLLNNLEEDVKEKLFKSMNNVNNISLLDSQAKRTYLKENNNCEDCQLKYIYGNEINKIDLIDSVKVRKYEVNVSALKELLSTKKKELKLTNKEISEILNIPKTTVDHWFRKDDSFAIPDSNIWFKLKDLLQIKTNSFDKSITEFIEKENMYEKSNRAYLVDGISPTLTTVNTDEKVIYPCAMIACEPRTDGMVLFNDNVCGTLRTIRACGDKHIIEGISEPMELPLCCASRGRNPENPNSRVSGLPTQQRLELNSNNTTNTLTTVQKDNYILEPCALKYERTEYGKEIRKDYESGKISEKIGNMRELSPRKDGICNTLTTVQKDNYIFDPSWFAIRKLIPLECFRLMGFSDENFNRAKYYTKEEAEEIKKSGKKYKTEIDEHGNEQIVCLSDSQAYKQAGNSIVTNVLYEVYKELYLAIPELFDDLKLVSLFSGIGAFEKGLDMFDEWRKNPKNFTIEEE